MATIKSRVAKLESQIKPVNSIPNIKNVVHRAEIAKYDDDVDHEEWKTEVRRKMMVAAHECIG